MSEKQHEKQMSTKRPKRPAQKPKEMKSHRSNQTGPHSEASVQGPVKPQNSKMNKSSLSSFFGRLYRFTLSDCLNIYQDVKKSRNPRLTIQFWMNLPVAIRCKEPNAMNFSQNFLKISLKEAETDILYFQMFIAQCALSLTHEYY